MDGMYQDVYYLSEELGHRLTGTENEKKASDWVAGKLTALGLKSETEEFSVASSAYAIYQFIFLACSFISFSFTVFTVPLKLFLLVLTAFFAVSFWKEFSFQHTFLYPLFKTRRSRNVYARIAPSGETKRTVYVVAHLDSATAGILFRPVFVKYLRPLIRLTFLSFLALFLNAFLFLAFPQKVSAFLFTLFGLFYIVSFLGAFHTEYMARPASGSNDNASSVAVLLRLMEHFTGHPLSRTEFIGLFTGAEETGCDGMYEFLKEHSFGIAADSSFLVLECTGIGRPVFLKSEGMLKKFHADPRLLALAEKVSADTACRTEGEDLPMGYTESEVLSNFGLRSLTIGAAPEERDTVPNWHQESDRVIYIRQETLARVFDFVKNLIGRIDEDESAAAGSSL